MRDNENQMIPVASSEELQQENLVEMAHIFIKNNTDVVKRAVLFGGFKNLDLPNFGSDEGIVISTKKRGDFRMEYSHLLRKTCVNNFVSNLTKVQSCNQKQPLNIIQVDSYGYDGIEKIPIITQSYFSASNYQEGDKYFVNVRNPIGIYGDRELSFDVLPDTEVEFIFSSINNKN